MAVEAGAKTDDGPFAGYAEPDRRPPFGHYALLSTVFNSALAGAVVAAKRSGRTLPERVGAGDLVLIGTASHKLSRTIAKDKVTAFVRAPFTEFQDKGGPGEVQERARGTGLRRTIGELLTCPFCLGLWTAGAFHVGILWAPRETRFVASTFTALTISDFLQIAYKAAEQHGLGD